MDLARIFGSVPFAIVGGVATRAYMPERFTKDIDILVHPISLERVARALEMAGWRRRGPLAFPGSTLGLSGSIWSDGVAEIDVLASEQPWCAAAIDSVEREGGGLPIVALAYLTLMKLDASRAVDQGDLARMLGPLSPDALDRTIAVVREHLHDPDIADDIRQYAQLGRWELENRPD